MLKNVKIVIKSDKDLTLDEFVELVKELGQYKGDTKEIDKSYV